MDWSITLATAGAQRTLFNRTSAGSGGEIGRQDEEGEADAQVSMDARRDPDLDDERGERGVEADLREETADRIFLPGALEDLGRHVHLLVEQQRAERPEADDGRDELNLARLAEQRECAGEADATLLDVAPPRPPRPLSRGRERSRRSPCWRAASPALHSSKALAPTVSMIVAVRSAPVMPPSITPPPMNPNSRFAWRGS